MNVIETVLNFEYLYLAHTSAYGSAKICHPTAPLVGFAAAIMTLSKTLLYWLQGEHRTNAPFPFSISSLLSSSPLE